MGYGGALIWTGLIRNLKLKYPDKKIIVIYKKHLKELFFKKLPEDYKIYNNNTDILLFIDKIRWFFIKWFFNKDDIILVDQNNKNYYYYGKCDDKTIEYKTGKHAIQIACDLHDIPDAILQPKIDLTEEEIKRADALLEEMQLKKAQYICIEPNFKETFTPNKAWFPGRWQELVDRLNKYINEKKLNIRIVQIGKEPDHILEGVVKLSGKMTFRETARILEKSITFISYMGGLIHLSKAVGKKSVTLISAWEPKEVASYPDDINLYTDIDCKHCGLLVDCPRDRECMKKITVSQVYEAAVRMIDQKS